jgi:iron complex outermembrane recepter protein
MTRSRKRKLQRCATKWAGMPLASAAFACTNVAFAQQAASSAQEVVGLEEVIVTAQKRSEDLQKVPISLTVLGTEQLEQHQVANFDDFVKLLPSVSYQSLGPGQNQLYFRGIASGGDGLHAGSLPATGMYLDETPVTTIAGSLDIHMYDIQRVEALAGPQGTLYGASSLSGTLRIITNKPDPSKFSASYDAEVNKYGAGNKYGTGGNGAAFEGYVNVPLSDRAAIRLVGYYGYDGGYISNVPGTVTYQRAYDPPFPAQPITFNNNNLAHDNNNGVTTYGGRAALKFDFADTWSITPQYLYQFANTKGPFVFDPKVGDLKVTDFRPESNKDSWYQTALTIQGKIGNIDALYTGGYFRRQVNNRVDYTGYTIGYDQCTSCGYTAFYNGGYWTGGPLGNQDPTQYTDNYDTYTKLTNEIRFSSPSDQRFRWILGGFAQHQTDDIRVEFRVDGLPDWYHVTGQGDVLYLSQQDRTDRDKAVFGDVTYDITDKFKMSAGMRYFWVDNSLYGFFGYGDNVTASGFSGSGEIGCTVNGVYVPSTNASNRPCINTNKDVTDSGETHRVNATYQVTPDKMVYATYSTGYRPGGNNRRSVVVPYNPDKLTNYELGWKTSWAENRVRFNGALFWEKWTDVQLGIQGVNGITSILNVGDAEVKGIEGELNWLAMEHLTLSLSGTYVDAKTTTQFCSADRVTGQVQTSCDPASAVANVGTQLPVTPKIKGNVNARYTFTAGSFDSFVQGTVFHQADVRNALQDDSAAAIGDSPAFTTFDLSAGISRDNWQLQAFIQNVFDERGELGRVTQCNDFEGYCQAHARVYPIKPQFFGIKFSQNF